MSELYHTDQTPQPHRTRRVKKFPPAKTGRKYCTDCEQEKLLDQFYVNPKGRTFSYCRECSRQRDKNRTQSTNRKRQYIPRRSLTLVYTREGYKVCPVCEQELLLEQFPLRGGKHVGSCIECTRAKDRERNRLRRPAKNPRKRQEDVQIPSRILPTQQCFICGEIKPLPMFELVKHSREERSNECRVCTEKRRKASITQQSLFFRICTDCGIEKSLSEDFYSNKGKYSYSCNECEKKQRSQWYKEHLDQVKAHHQKRKTNPKYIEYHREYERMRYNTIPDVASKARESNKVYRKANPLKRREINSRREARKTGNKVGKVSYKRILERDGYYCYICEQAINQNAKKKSRESLVFDHVIPLVPRTGETQGTHSMDNIRPAHNICNSRKKNKPFYLLTPFERQGP